MNTNDATQIIPAQWAQQIVLKDARARKAVKRAQVQKMLEAAYEVAVREQATK